MYYIPIRHWIGTGCWVGTSNIVLKLSSEIFFYFSVRTTYSKIEAHVPTKSSFSYKWSTWHCINEKLINSYHIKHFIIWCENYVRLINYYEIDIYAVLLYSCEENTWIIDCLLVQENLVFVIELYDVSMYVWNVYV